MPMTIRQVLWLCIGALLFLAGATPSALADKRVALLIGNSAYEALPSLKTPAGNVRALEEALAKAGFDKVETALDLKHDDLIRKLRAFEDEAASADIALLYYSGHGLEHGKYGLIVPIDARLASERDLGDETVTVDRLQSAMDGAKALKLLILDASRDDPIGGAKTNPLRCCILPRVESPDAGTLILYAAKAGSVAMEGSGPVDPYTQALVSHLFEPGLDLRLAVMKVRDDVMAATDRRQEPFAYGSLAGEKIVLAK